MNGTGPTQVVYLFGAGASHACVKAVGSAHGILMEDIGDSLREDIRQRVANDYGDHPELDHLVNTVITEDTDLEHIITFLDQSTSSLHRRFAEELRRAFERVLTAKLNEIQAEVGSPPVDLYDALLDLYNVKGFSEELRGILTINYDEYIESAIKNAGGWVDFGIDIRQEETERRYQLLKLHGSFGWEHSWPVPLRSGNEPLWIPPGIQKAKDEYPFNLLWGRARELLDCDLLRIVGCRLGPNDWDLISLIFTTSHTNARRPEAYRVEVINSPSSAMSLRESHPYLDAQSILEQEPVGKRLISELLGGPPRPFKSLTVDDQSKLEELDFEANWFRLWLIHMAEATFETLGSLDTPRGVIRNFMEKG